MGKIFEALGKYSGELRKVEERKPRERKAPEPVALNQSDVYALVNYDRRTGHLLRCDRETGQVDSGRIEALRNRGVIQRLLQNGLIHPSGKLTRQGQREAKRLEGVVELRRAPDKPVPPPPRTMKPAPAVEAPLAPRAVEPLPRPAVRQPAPPAPALVRPQPAAPEDDLIVAYDPAAAVERPPAVETPAAAARAPSQEALRKTRPQPAARPRFNDAQIDPTLVTLKDPYSLEAEQFKILRTNILYPVSGQPPRSILITSAAPGDGKSFAAANLAASIAMNINRHVLLIDADLRRPDLHRRFGFGEVPGLSNFLSDGASLPSLLLKTRVDKLTLLPAGTPPPNPSELLSSEGMADLMAEVSARYSDRLIVVDAPPLNIAAEGGVLARQVEGVLIVIRHGRTRRDEILNLLSRVEEEKILGCFLNGIDRRTSRYYGYYEYDKSQRQPRR